VRFSIRFDNAGISQLTDEVVAAVTRGGAMPEAADECKGDADGFVGRRGTEWLPGGGVRGNLGDRPGGVGAGEA
jgi:hypothetical protein